MSNQYSYNDIINISNNLDRNIYKLNNESAIIFSNLKNKLKINNYLQNNDFSSTFIKKNNEEYMNNLFKFLNKLTNKNYDKISVQIIDLVKKNYNSPNNKNIIDKFFNIIITNSIFCHLYAKVFSSMIKEDNSFIVFFNKKIELYLKDFDNIKYISPNENYDNYCKYIKQIENLKNFTTFLIECLNYNICDISKISYIIIFLQDNIIKNIDNEENLSLNENYCLNICIIIKKCINLLTKENDWHIIKNKLNLIYNTNGTGKNKRIQFNIMDIKEIIDKL
tara:strand:- start:760 stop:1596 length:837 start_codon:yes stop_codon:yes gene_type:complete